MTVKKVSLLFHPTLDGGGGDCCDDYGAVNIINNYCCSSCIEFGMKRNGRHLIVMVIGLLLLLPPSSQALSTKVGDIRVEVNVPKEAEVGASAELKCKWRLTGGNSLYSVKWYKDDHEFFRYVPDNDPRIQTFPQPNVHLDNGANTENSIRLTKLALGSSGQYKCEVSTEAPSFATTYRTANLTVIALPERGPEITGLSSHYAVGENVTANCTAWPSVPKANMFWIINGEQVPQENTIAYPTLPPQSAAGIPNSLGLRLEAEARHFEGGGGVVTIRCVADVSSRRYETERRVLMAHVNNQRLSAGDLLRGGSISCCSNSLNLVVIVITAMKALAT